MNLDNISYNSETKKVGLIVTGIGLVVSLLKSKPEMNIGMSKRNGHMNAPTFAYYTAYGKEPEQVLRGRTNSESKTWNGIPDIDVHIKDKWLEELNNVEGIEIRATDEGKSKERVAFVIFRMSNSQEDSRAKEIARKLDKMNRIKAKSNVGNQGRPRICVAGKTKYGDSDWEEWWDSLAGKVKRGVKG